MLLHTRHPIGIWILLLVLVSITALMSQKLFSIWANNQLIKTPADITVLDDSQPAHVIFSKAVHLNQQGDYQQALRLFSQIKQTASPALQNRIYYNMGTIYLQQASKLWTTQGVWESNQINTLLDLAEQALHQVLKSNPQHKQARYNLEYVLRIRPPGKEQESSDWTGHKSSVHAVMPGIPTGGP